MTGITFLLQNYFDRVIISNNRGITNRRRRLNCIVLAGQKQDREENKKQLFHWNNIKFRNITRCKTRNLILYKNFIINAKQGRR